MATYRTRVESPLTREEAFDYLSDFQNAAEWDSNTVSSVCLGGDPRSVGARFEVVTGFGGRNLTLIYETIELERPNRVVFRSDTAISSIQDTIVFESVGDGSVVDYEARISMKGLAKVFDPLFGLIFGPVGDRAAAGLRKALKAE